MSQDIEELQLLEQSMSHLVSQKQNFQVQLNEIDSALKEIKGKQKAYKIVGGLMIEKPKSEIEEELTSKKEMLEVRIKSLEQQEGKMSSKKEVIQKKVMEKMQNGEDKPDN